MQVPAEAEHATANPVDVAEQVVTEAVEAQDGAVKPVQAEKVD